MKAIRMCLVLLAVSLLAACVMPEDGGSSGGGAKTGAHSSKGGGTINVCGTNFTLGDLVSHPMFRQPLQQFVILQEIYAEASKQGITVSDEEITEAIDEQKKQIEASGQTWDDFMKMQGMDDTELGDMIKTQKLFEKLLETKMDMSDERLKTYWETNKERVLKQHIQANFLPESELQTLTYDDCIDTVKEFIKQEDGYNAQQLLMDDLVINATLDLSGVLSEEEAKAVLAAVLGNDQEEARGRQAGADATEGEGASEGIVSEGTGMEGQENVASTSTQEVPEGGEEAAPEGETPAEPEGEGESTK